ncbi:MAG: tRNA preQ1(34) S-adenosylmethionine ribosyltransferase-isomerase QueA [Acholeplasmataceae bacterium]
MKTDDFNFNLPENLIAQHPEDKRDHSKLLVINRKNDEITHHHFYDIVDFINPNSVLVMNDTKVIPAKLIGEKTNTKAHIEVLLLNEVKKDTFEALVKPARRIKVNDTISFGNGILTLNCLEVKDEGIRVFKANYQGIFLEVLDKLGEMPLPPYIKERLLEKDRYQTVYAKIPGSSVAPTAGFHFTKEILTKIKEKGIEIIYVTLHVGLGTFRPVKVTNPKKHHMHSEEYYITKESADKLNQAIKDKKEIIAVGTTTVRVLESNYNGKINEGHFKTDIFIYPGYQFKVINSLITNFHLPKSTLLMLVSAFYNREKMLNVYNLAVKNNYRFFSFGDSMFLK